MARGMSAPPGAWQRAAFVAVPLGLVVLIFLTPGILAPDRPQPTDIPLLTIEVIDRPWNGTVNETGLLHVRSALGTAVYDAIDIRATDANETHAASATDAPSLWLKVPVVDGWTVNVSTMAVKDTATFEKPHGYAAGFSDVLVNGVAVVRNGEHTGAKPGVVLAHSSSVAK